MDEVKKEHVLLARFYELAAKTVSVESYIQVDIVYMLCNCHSVQCGLIYPFRENLLCFQAVRGILEYCFITKAYCWENQKTIVHKQY